MIINYQFLNKMLFFVTIAVILVLYNRYVYDGTEFITSSIDNNCYRVRNVSDKYLKADMLAMLKNKLDILVESLKNNPKHNSNVNVKRLVSNWNKGVSIKEIGNMETDAAYVINKKYMSFCLQESPGREGFTNKNTIEHINLLTYVGIHETSHIMSGEIGHGPEFIQNFEFLLNYAKTLKDQSGNPLYIQLNTLKTPDHYCGVSLVNSIS
jgi:hypothetical protein